MADIVDGTRRRGIRLATILSVISILLGAISIVVSIVALPSKPAHVDATLLMDVDVLALPRSLQLPLHYMWENRLGTESEVKNLRVVYFSVFNTGGQPLEWDRVLGGPIYVEVAGKAKLLHVDRIPGPEACTIKINPDWKSFTFSTRFLNPREGLVLFVAHSGDAGALRIEGSALGQGPISLVPLTIKYWQRGDVLKTLNEGAYLACFLLVLEAIKIGGIKSVIRAAFAISPGVLPIYVWMGLVLTVLAFRPSSDRLEWPYEEVYVILCLTTSLWALRRRGRFLAQQATL